MVMASRTSTQISRCSSYRHDFMSHQRLVRRATLEYHANGGARAQRQSRPRQDRLVRKQLHIKSLQNHGHNQAHFEHGELVADALVGPAQEGEIRALRALRDALRCEAARIKHLGLFPEGWVT